jgi:hypothetical protein
VTTPLTDEDLPRIRSALAGRAIEHPAIRALLAGVVDRCHNRFHWLTEGREDILSDWLETRLLRTGRLQAMVDKARSVAALRRLAELDLKQYATDRRRTELPTRLFKRIDKLLRARPEHFLIMEPSANAGATCWTLTSRPAAALFSERDHELIALVHAAALNTLDEEPGAGKQSQFISSIELERYVSAMLDRSARGLSLDQLVRGLVLAYNLEPTFEDLPDADVLDERLGGSIGESTGRARLGDPPDPRIQEAARKFVDGLTPRQAALLRKARLVECSSQQAIADDLGCSPALVSAEKTAIAKAISALVSEEQRVPLIGAALELLNAEGDDHG